MSIETISYEGHVIECAPHRYVCYWGFAPPVGSDLPVSKMAPIWSRMADRKAAARDWHVTCEDVKQWPIRTGKWIGDIDKGHRRFVLRSDLICELAGLGLFLALLALVPS